MESLPFDPLDLVRPDLRSMEKYVGVLPLEVVAEEIGVELDEIVKLDANENLYGVLPEITQQIASANHHIYPDPSQTFLRRDLATYMNVSESMIVAGAGSDDLIDIVIRMVRPGPVLISTPTFGMYSFLSNISQLPVIDVPRGPPPTFLLDVPKIVSCIREQRVSVVFLVSPNNPTGTLISNEDVALLCEERSLIVVDEAYAEFSGVSAAPLVAKFPNLVILRTFSKWSGLAGLRAGFAVACDAIANVMMSIKQPYNINVAADVACRAALAHRATIQGQIDAIVMEREYLRTKLSNFAGLSPLASASNFFLCEVKNAQFTAKQLRLYLRRLGVLIRFFEKPSFMSQFIRISAGRRRDSDELLRCVNLIYSTQLLSNPIKSRFETLSAIFFDMDGVLADESSSYRSAIILTSLSYGIQIGEEDISAAKAAGASNNDWICTQQILESRGVVAPLEEITTRFEAFYQGTETQPGLWQTETLIPRKSLIKFLASKVALAIVTGRPRADAIRFLKHHHILPYFKTIVCMEDAPSKPDPAPVLLALQNCELQAGPGGVVMIGDTPNDALVRKSQLNIFNQLLITSRRPPEVLAFLHLEFLRQRNEETQLWPLLLRPLVLSAPYQT
eukprot:TRINITY_DN252_c0_g1_i7.p1 TRINITY_DN252_c0_g1~~TRINITY_DN252_c0_g1_i7.p1  ORF type:complete len:619 (+),score=88.25 TRINITY_DN252_c0_g1_i7:4469-6325(+)